MDILALGFVYALVFFIDWLALKYRAMLMFSAAGIISLLALAESAADNSFDTWHFLNQSGNIVNDFWTPTSDAHSWQLMILTMSVIAIVHFAMVIQIQLSRSEKF